LINFFITPQILEEVQLLANKLWQTYKSKEDPYIITVLTDAEGCFSVSVYKKDKAKFKRVANIEFTIGMSEDETKLLEMVKSFFDCGVLRQNNNNNGTVRFRVKDFSSIKNIIIPHFVKFPLRGTKYLDFYPLKRHFKFLKTKSI
jgi:LAGLIDADG endonuclease